MIALGTHQPMSEEAICHRLEISVEERRAKYGTVRLFNHEWDNTSALKYIGTISAGEIKDLSGGLFAMDVPVNVNRRIFDYDQIIIAGPVFPHEVVGFSGGNKYLFPGVSGPEVLNFFHWLGAVVTNPMIIGNKYTPVRKVVDYGQPSPHGATATVTITNTGHQTGAEVAQLYLTDPAAAGEPPYQLKGFRKVTLAPGHSQRITLQLTTKDMSYYQTATSSWVAAPGLYRVSIGSNERDLPVSAPFYRR